MDDELQELEAELRRLRPLAPSLRLRAGLEQRLAVRPRAKIVRLAWLAMPVAAAAVMVLALLPASHSEKAAVPASQKPGVADAGPRAPGLFEPVSAEDIVLHPRAESLVTLADGTVARRTSESYLATITWRNPRTKASLTWQVPREEVRVVPVSYQ